MEVLRRSVSPESRECNTFCPMSLSEALSVTWLADRSIALTMTIVLEERDGEHFLGLMIKLRGPRVPFTFRWIAGSIQLLTGWRRWGSFTANLQVSAHGRGSQSCKCSPTRPRLPSIWKSTMLKVKSC